MKVKILSFLLIMAVCFMTAISVCADNAKGYIDWENSQWRAEGVVPLSQKGNRAMQIKKAHDFAKLEALSNLLQLIQGTNVCVSEKGIMTGDDYTVDKTIMSEIQGYIKNVKEEKYEIYEEFGAEWVRVVIVSGIYGQSSPGSVLLRESVKNERLVLSSVDLSKTEQPKVSVPASVPVVIAAGSVFPAVKENVSATSIYAEKKLDYYPIVKSNIPYTGLIIDATGFKLTRSMSPKIRLENGDIVWTGANFDMDSLFDKGILAYASSVAKAKENSRVGSNPMIIRAVNVMGQGGIRCDICLKADDAAYMKNENVKTKFLDEFKIIVVSDFR